MAKSSIVIFVAKQAKTPIISFEKCMEGCGDFGLGQPAKSDSYSSANPIQLMEEVPFKCNKMLLKWETCMLKRKHSFQLFASLIVGEVYIAH